MSIQFFKNTKILFPGGGPERTGAGSGLGAGDMGREPNRIGQT